MYRPLTRRLRPALAAAVMLSAGLLSSGVASAACENSAPDWTLRDLNNQQISLSDYKGQVVLMNFWATWCGPCMLEMPHLQAMYDDLKDQGFTVLSVSTDDARDASKVKPLVKAKRLTFPVVLDKDTTVVAEYNPAKTLPYSVVINQEGCIDKVHQGYNPGDETVLRAEIEALLAGSSAPATTAPASTAADPDGPSVRAPQTSLPVPPAVPA